MYDGPGRRYIPALPTGGGDKQGALFIAPRCIKVLRITYGTVCEWMSCLTTVDVTT